MTSIFGPELAENPLWPSGLPSRLSPSQITEFLTCPEKWRRSRLKNERAARSVALVIGTADSAARAADLSHKIETGVNLSDDDVRHIAAMEFGYDVDQAGGNSEIDWSEKDTDWTPGAALDLTVNLASAYRQQVSLNLAPLAVEEHLEMSFEGIAPSVHGYLDVRTATEVREVKTSAVRRTKPLPDWSVQCELYCAATGLPARVDVAVKKSLEIVTADAEPGLELHADGQAAVKLEARLRAVAGGILALYNQFGPDEPWPATGAVGMMSRCSICDHKRTCLFSTAA